MGCFNEIDAVTRLAILAGEPVVAILPVRLIHKANRKTRTPRTVTVPFDDMCMLPSPGYHRIKVFHGTYDDYGGLEENSDEIRKLQEHAPTVMLRESTMEFVRSKFKQKYRPCSDDAKETREYAKWFKGGNARVKKLVLDKGKRAVEWGIGQLSHDRFPLDADFDTIMPEHTKFEYSFYLDLKPKVMTDEQFEAVSEYADEWNDIIFPLFWFCLRAHIKILGTTEMGTQARFFGMAVELAKFTIGQAEQALEGWEDMDEL